MLYLVVKIERTDGTTYEQLIEYTDKDVLKRLQEQLGKYKIIEWRWY